MHSLTDYDVKVLVGFHECLKLNRKMMDLYVKAFPELAALAACIHSDNDAFNWLIKNGYPEFAALSDSIDDEDEATEWLKKYNCEFLSLFAAACRKEKDAIKWFADRDLKLFLMLIATIQQILLQQALDSDNVHKRRVR